jgi:glycosyltransferase involved in cell wall biosynthesis
MTDARRLTFDLILATLGRRPAELRRFLRSVVDQDLPGCRVLIVDQSEGDAVTAVLTEFAGRLEMQHRTSETGLSRARNVGLASSTGDVVAFPDDDCAYPPGLLNRVEAVLRADPQLHGVSVRAITPTGTPTLTRWDRGRGLLDRGNVWRRAVSPGIFLRRGLIDRVGMMDERLGVGAGSPWGSGEETDYLIRAIDLGFRVLYEPSLHVFHPDRGASVRSAAQGEKYGLGMGYVLGKHGYTWLSLARCYTRPLAGAALKTALGRLDEARFHAAVARGRRSGWRAARGRR